MKKSKIYQGKIPFDKNGNQLHFPEHQHFWFSEWDENTKIGILPETKEEVNLSNYDNDLISIGHIDEYTKKYNRNYHIIVTPLKDNFVFEDTLIYNSYGRGRSAAYFYFKRESNGKEVTVFMSVMDELINKMVNGKITGKFTFHKKGANFGCKLVD